MSCTSASASIPTQQTSPEQPTETSLALPPQTGCESMQLPKSTAPSIPPSDAKCQRLAAHANHPTDEPKESTSEAAAPDAQPDSDKAAVPTYTVDIEPDASDEDSEAAQHPLNPTADAKTEVSRPEPTLARSMPEHRDNSQTPESTGGRADSSIRQARANLTPVAVIPRPQHTSTRPAPTSFLYPTRPLRPHGLPGTILIRTAGKKYREGYRSAMCGCTGPGFDINCLEFYDEAAGELAGHVGLHYEIQRRMLQARPTIFLHTPGVVVGG